MRSEQKTHTRSARASSRASLCTTRPVSTPMALEDSLGSLYTLLWCHYTLPGVTIHSLVSLHTPGVTIHSLVSLYTPWCHYTQGPYSARASSRASLCTTRPVSTPMALECALVWCGAWCHYTISLVSAYIRAPIPPEYPPGPGCAPSAPCPRLWPWAPVCLSSLFLLSLFSSICPWCPGSCFLLSLPVSTSPNFLSS